MIDTTPHDISSWPGPDVRHRHTPYGWAATVVLVVLTALVASALTAGFIAAAGYPTRTRTVTTTSVASNWVSVASAVEPSVVAVRVAGPSGGDEGSGIILDTSGRILTNDHVIAAGGAITVALTDGRIYPATPVGADTSTDLAVLRLTSPPTGLTPAVFADSGTLKVGDPVMAVGNPLGLSDTATTGIVSALNRPVVTTGDSARPAQPTVTNAIQTDAPINPGNSGGALVDAAGKVVGVTSSIASLDTTGSGQSGSIGLGFAIPADEAGSVAHQIVATGAVAHAYLGVSFTDGTATVNGVSHNAALIHAVAAGSPAAKAGLHAGDAVIAVNGNPLDDADSLAAQVRAMSPGAALTLTVAAGGSSHPATLTLAAEPTH